MKNHKLLLKTFTAAVLILSLVIGSSVFAFADDNDFVFDVGEFAVNGRYVEDAPIDFYSYDGRYPSGMDNELYNGVILAYGVPDTAETTEVEVVAFAGGKKYTYHEKYRINGKVNDSGIGDGKML
ncbi:MAG: hypothetical protein K6G42_07780, partial [Lachnospiraceae bacterium]|nr:hypothetical protein [Lachnospiraceae bacterium]